MIVDPSQQHSDLSHYSLSTNIGSIQDKGPLNQAPMYLRFMTTVNAYHKRIKIFENLTRPNRESNPRPFSLENLSQ